MPHKNRLQAKSNLRKPNSNTTSNAILPYRKETPSKMKNLHWTTWGWLLIGLLAIASLLA